MVKIIQRAPNVSRRRCFFCFFGPARTAAGTIIIISTVPSPRPRCGRRPPQPAVLHIRTRKPEHFTACTEFRVNRTRRWRRKQYTFIRTNRVTVYTAAADMCTPLAVEEQQWISAIRPMPGRGGSVKIKWKKKIIKIKKIKSGKKKKHEKTILRWPGIRLFSVYRPLHIII